MIFLLLFFFYINNFFFIFLKRHRYCHTFLLKNIKKGIINYSSNLMRKLVENFSFLKVTVLKPNVVSCPNNQKRRKDSFSIRSNLKINIMVIESGILLDRQYY